MVFVNSLAQQETVEKFAHLWFAGMAKFHRVKDPCTWEFDERHVIAYLRSKLSTRMPTWKRLKIIEGLRCEAEREASAFWSIRFCRGLMSFL
jgi:hypothetical protein